MSENIVKLIPIDPFVTVSEETFKKATHYIETHVICDSVNTKISSTPKFIDCGENLKRIICPICGADIDFGWWGKAMNRAYEESFSSLETTLPCCSATVSLNDLDYQSPCGFACFSIEILNPGEKMRDSVILPVQNLLGVTLRVVNAHI